MKNLKLSDGIFSQLFAKEMCSVTELQHRAGDPSSSWTNVYGLRLGMTMHKPEQTPLGEHINLD